MYGFTTPLTLCDDEALLYVQEVQLDKFRQELATSNVSANIAHTSQEENRFRVAYLFYRGRGRSIRGRSRGRGRNTTTSRPTCQLCGKYEHSVITCWHGFGENCMPPSTISASSNTIKSSNLTRGSTQDDAHDTQTMEMMATTSRPNVYTQEYSMLLELESQSWFVDSAQIVNRPSHVNVPHELSNASSTRPTVPNYPKGNHHVEVSTYNNSPSPPIPSSKPIESLLENAHHMLTRAKTGHSKPKAYILHTEPEPISVKQALLQLEWAKAMRNEFNAL
ncbi:hypothetical protein KIW84_065792 [Lathyrus oleraceus]|uniref:Uncharacterized protein n=1 Tax=Pisum sativum TaxID=3888 RepID=A0A9D4WGK1_PEA|nr:hypothetical protein KIW84_065792 [Pisum sativum]